MTTPDDIDFQRCVEVLAAQDTPRVWSLIVSFFGDMAQRKGDEVSGATLGDLLSLIGVKPQAMRTALHRLKADGWIDSRRAGRGSRYFLTERGRHESASASPRIYAAERADFSNWSLAIAAPGERNVLEQGDGRYRVDDRLTLVRSDRSHEFDHWKLPIETPPPKWLRASIMPEGLVAHCAVFHEKLLRLQASMPDVGALTPLQIVVLRTLLVHNWRRIALREPPLPPEFFPDDWHGELCREATNRLLGKLPRPALEELAPEHAQV